MIQLSDKKDCCGCSACVQRCPKQCIRMVEDYEGFLYPQIDTSRCIDCGLCEKVCPIINNGGGSPRDPLKVLAANNKNLTIRTDSSSGGIFTLLAEQTLRKGGVVFGARFDKDWQVVMDYTETIEGLSIFRGSKYVQCRFKDSFKDVERFLKEGRVVLYSANPCVIAALRKFLRKDYANLLAVDFLCHGVPSPGVWQRYLQEVRIDQKLSEGKSSVLPSIKDIQFRDKSQGWKKFRFVLNLSYDTSEGQKSTVLSSVYNANIYMSGFLHDIILRPSCYTCPAREGKSLSDITIADYWGIEHRHPELDDDQGTGLVMIYTQKGVEAFPFDKVDFKESSLEGLLPFNGGLKTYTEMHPKREWFFQKFAQGDSVSKSLRKIIEPSFTKKVVRKIFRILKIK